MVIKMKDKNPDLKETTFPLSFDTPFGRFRLKQLGMTDNLVAFKLDFSFERPVIITSHAISELELEQLINSIKRDCLFKLRQANQLMEEDLK